MWKLSDPGDSGNTKLLGVSGCQGVYFNKNQFKNFNKEWKRELELKVRNIFNM